MRRATGFNVEKIRRDFPVLKRKINGKRLVYLDSAATSQKPAQVINAITDYYENHNANVHRSVHRLSEEATLAYDGAHKKVADFINADFEEIIFTRNTTESINLVMQSYGMNKIKRGDEIVISQMEHHSNLVPWQQLAKSKGAVLKYLEVDPRTGRIRPEEIARKITKKARLISVCHMSNALGTVNDISQISEAAQKCGAVFVVDAAQSVPHMPVDVKKIGCDFLAFSGHKMLGPTGIGVLFGRKDLLAGMDPFLFGGDMISSVTYEDSKWNDLPWKFEAGTPNIAGAIGLASAMDYLQGISMDSIQQHDKELTRYALNSLKEVRHLTIHGPSDMDNRGPAISFSLGDIHPHDVATLLDRDGIAVRGGHHCAMPLARLLGVTATTRASFYLYNTKEEIDLLTESLDKAAKVFRL